MADENKSKSRLIAKTPSDITSFSLEDYQQTLSSFYELVNSCRGPQGNIKIIQNSCGGHLTMTSTSCRLFSAMSFSKPVTHLIINAVKGHLRHFQDGGHFAVTLCLNLVLESIKTGNNRRILIDLFEICMETMLAYLSSQDSLSVIKHNVKLSNIQEMSAVVKSILRTKPMCALSGVDVQVLNSILLQIFLKTLPNNGKTETYSDKVKIIALEGKETKSSMLYDGLLIEWPEVPGYITKCLNYKCFELQGSEKKKINVALVTVSMSGDSEELGNVNYEVRSGTNIDEAMLDMIRSFCEKLVQSGVDLVLCQRVMHPLIKLYLKQNMVLVIDRCGLSTSNYIRDITGANAISSFHSVNINDFGSVELVKHEVLQNKSYLMMTSSTSNVSTLVLYCPQEERLEELKVLCTTVLMTLKRLLQNSMVLSGAGCWQIHLAEVLKHQITNSRSKVEEMMNKCSCTKTTVLSACKVFIQSLQNVACRRSGMLYMTSKAGHLWRIHEGHNIDLKLPCECGMLSENLYNLQYLDIRVNIENLGVKPMEMLEVKQDIVWGVDSVVDELSMCINALKTAVLTANTVLSIGQYVNDIN